VEVSTAIAPPVQMDPRYPAESEDRLLDTARDFAEILRGCLAEVSERVDVLL
jgi:hypothetical protein